MTCFRSLGIIAFLLLFAQSPAWPQRGAIRSSGIPTEETQPDPAMVHKMQEQQMKKRFEEMKRDSQKLLELATELKQYVDKSGENVLSLEVIRKADEMERLARQVKKNMRAE